MQHTGIPYTKIKGVKFEETFTLWLDLNLLGVCYLQHAKQDKLFQMDVKSTFLNGILNEEAYVEQPKGFIDPHLEEHVFKLKKGITCFETISLSFV